MLHEQISSHESEFAWMKSELCRLSPQKYLHFFNSADYLNRERFSTQTVTYQIKGVNVSFIYIYYNSFL